MQRILATAVMLLALAGLLLPRVSHASTPPMDLGQILEQMAQDKPLPALPPVGDPTRETYIAQHLRVLCQPGTEWGDWKYQEPKKHVLQCKFGFDNESKPRFVLIYPFPSNKPV